MIITQPLYFSVYIDATDACATLSFHLTDKAVAVERKWAVKIVQYSCDYTNLAPKGCLQYFYGATTGTASSFNFEGGNHLANQNQKICVR